MKKFLTGAAFALALTAAPAMADDHTDDMIELTSTQQAMYDSWPADRRMTYDNWPEMAQAYYWTIDSSDREAWWALNDEQRVRIVNMTPEMRQTTWASLRSQMAGMNNGVATARANTAGNITFRRSERAQSMPTNYTESTPGDLPVCSANQQSGCINSWERNRTGTRPLDYWPGRPASQMD